jgi:lipoprotein-anchoring transpeptidase ErfK/SrfK
MRKVFGVAVAGLAALAFAATADIGSAATGGKQQNFSSGFTKPKPATPQAARRNDCQDIFRCLFGADGNRKAKFSDGKRYRQVVDFNDSKYAPGSIIVRTPERALYYVLPEGEAIRYRVGVGRDGFQWSGASRIIDKREWPSWTPPARMIAREAAKGNMIPTFMEGGPGNPLGARALYIGGTIFRIHGTNDARTIGGAVSSGCIRMLNADVIDLYERVKVGSPVYVYQ